MSRNDRTRSKLMIDAVVQAAASGPLNKLAAIAGLAGFVLRLFRSRVSVPPPAPRICSQRPATVQPASRQRDRRKAEAGAAGKGGCHHG